MFITSRRLTAAVVASPAKPRGRLWRSRWAAIGAAAAVTLGAGGVVELVGAASSDPSSFVSITTVRVLDSRDLVDVGLAGPFVSAISQDLTIAGTIATTGGAQVVVPVGATGVALNVTVVSPSADGFLSIRPADAPGSPTTSSLNFSGGDIVPNAVNVQLPVAGADAGRIEITYDAYGLSGPVTDVLIDVVGYYVAASAGPTGFAQVTTRTTSFTFLPNDGTISQLRVGNAQCAAGETPVSGGYDLAVQAVINGVPNVIVERSRPALANGNAPNDGATPTGWLVAARRRTDIIGETVTVHVLCAAP